MERNPQALEDKEFDILVIGAGMFGVCVAWSAILRGYSVAVVDKADFGGETSANHYKFIHSGVRYLQHLDIARMRESSRERSALVRVAPHLCSPLPIVLPTYGYGKRGKALMRAGMLVYDILTPDRNRRIVDPERRIPNGSAMSRDEVMKMFPGTATEGLTGAAVLNDGQIYNSPRLSLAFLRAAISKGAVALNYMAAKQLLRDGKQVKGCAVEDQLTGSKFNVRSKMVVNATGPWASEFLLQSMGLNLETKPSFSRDLAFVVNKSICPSHAIGCQAKSHDADALLDRGGRHLFLVPWRGRTLVGVWHRYSKAHPDCLSVSKEELMGFIAEINGAYKGLDLKFEDISMINTGHILFGEESDQGSDSDHSFAKRSFLTDHADVGIEGLMTLVGARATVARGMGDATLDKIDAKLKGGRQKISSQWQPIYGGDFTSFSALVEKIKTQLPNATDDVATSLAHNYGAAYQEVIDCAPEASYLEPVSTSTVIKAEILHALRHEMAIGLADVVFRRTELCTAGDPGDEAVNITADIVASELGWSKETRDAEVAGVCEILKQNGPWQFVDREDQMSTAG